LIGKTDLNTACRPSSGRRRRARHLQELVVGGLLNLDEVRHLRDFGDLAELLFQQLRQLSGLEDGQGRQVFNELGEISHFTSYKVRFRTFVHDEERPLPLRPSLA
jgi:hypothetical protein